MNISRVHTSGGTGIGAAGPVQRKSESDVSVSETKKSDVQEAQPQAKRLAAYAEKIDKRMENAIASSDLSEREVNALKDATEDFQALMQRIGNADLSAEASKKHFLSVLNGFTSKVGSILDAAQAADDVDPTRTLNFDASAKAPAKIVPSAQSKIDTLA